MENPAFVPETRFGIWFLSSETWLKRVLEVAVADLARLLGSEARQNCDVVLDVGCSQEKLFSILSRRFNPRRLIALDADPKILEVARSRSAVDKLSVDLLLGSGSAIPLPDNSVDLLFCHQTFHHLIDHEAAIGEFHRVLKPGGVLLFAESTKAYIHSWIIPLLFRHPMEVQKTADEYLALIRRAGFDVAPARISYPYLWWSRSDLGLMERLRIKAAPRSGHRVETLLNLVATKP
jgi:ubiquinone/menaquinone biosynthesis C-methylase UbiE